MLWACSLAAGFYFCRYFTSGLSNCSLKIAEKKLAFAGTLAVTVIFTVLAVILLLSVYAIFKNGFKACGLKAGRSQEYNTLTGNEDGNKTLKIILIFSSIIFIASGFLSHLNLYCGDNHDFFRIINYFKSEDLKPALYVEGRISDYVRYNRGQAGFLFDVHKLTVTGKHTVNAGSILTGKNEKALKIQNEVFVVVKNSAILSLERDDYISFNFELPHKKNHSYIITYSENITKITPEKINSLFFDIRKSFYGCISNIFNKSLSNEHAAVSEALILGNQYKLSTRTVDDFKKSGIYHLLSISGLHISFFMVIVCRFTDLMFSNLLLKKNKDHKIRYIIPAAIISVLFLYNFIVGQKASMLRATLMSVLIIFANFWAKDFDRKYILSITFILLLIFNPEFFMSTGFWLSFASLFAIIYVNKTISEMLNVIRKKVRTFIFQKYDAEKMQGRYFSELLVTTLSVNLIIFPVIVFKFREFSFLSFFTNIAAIPLSYVLLFILISASVSGLFWPAIGMLLVKPAQILIFLLLKISRLWRTMDFTVIGFGEFGIFHLVMYYFFLISTLLLLYKFNDRTARVKNKI